VGAWRPTTDGAVVGLDGTPSPAVSASCSAPSAARPGAAERGGRPAVEKKTPEILKRSAPVAEDTAVIDGPPRACGPVNGSVTSAGNWLSGLASLSDVAAREKWRKTGGLNPVAAARKSRCIATVTEWLILIGNCCLRDDRLGVVEQPVQNRGSQWCCHCENDAHCLKGCWWSAPRIPVVTLTDDLKEQIGAVLSIGKYPSSSNSNSPGQILLELTLEQAALLRGGQIVDDADGVGKTTGSRLTAGSPVRMADAFSQATLPKKTTLAFCATNSRRKRFWT